MTQPTADLFPEEIVIESLRGQLLYPASWREGLENYARATHLAVALVDTRGQLLGECLNPTQLWALFARSTTENGCAFSIWSLTRCTCVADAQEAGKPVFVHDRAGLVHFAVPLLLHGCPLGAVIAGQVFDHYAQTLPLDQAAKSAGLSPQHVWRLARREHPISRATLKVYANLLAALANDFLRARYHSIIEAERLAEVTKLRDIAEAELFQRKQIEKALRQREERLRATFNQAAIGMSLIALDGRFLEVNGEVCDIAGYSQEELLGRSLLDILHPNDRADTHELVRRLLAGEIGEFPLERRLIRKGGTSAWVNVTITPLRDDSGQPELLIGVIEDITDRVQAEEERIQLLACEQSARAEADKANRLKDEFLVTISHELRTPMTTIFGWARLLQSGALSESDREQGLETIYRNAKIQARLIDEILDISRIVSGKLRLDLRPADVGEIVDETVTSLRLAAEEKGIRLQAEHGPPCPISGDPNRLQQVLWNLLSNALKFTPTGGQVDVRFQRTNSHVEITVADSGEGIDPDFLPHVFEPFRQADASLSRKHGGLGLGLAIVRQLVELHGGTVRADSPGKGQGATFMVVLPCEPLIAAQTIALPQRLPARAGRDAPPARLLEGLRVLVVDDEPDARALLSTMLTQYGAKVEAAASTSEALEALDRLQPDVLISDIGMPGEDGYVLIRKVRALEAERGTKRAIPGIALTAYTREEDHSQALAAGYHVHLAKPVEPAEFVMAVAAAGRTAASQVA